MNKTNLGVALVTGASTGIGQATANTLQNAGFRVFGTCAYHLSHPDIFVMESAEEWDCCE
jgi:NAD(P)-dependent dehydrogenase (short-subunit alcohol dehydrogenase family)